MAKADIDLRKGCWRDKRRCSNLGKMGSVFLNYWMPTFY